MGRTTTFRVNGWTLADVTSFFCILQSVSVDQSGGLRMDIGVLYLSHAMLVLAELIVCSTRGFACILAKWFWPTEISLSFKATFQLTIFMCGKRATDKIQRNNCHHGSCGSSLTYETSSESLIFTHGTHRNVKNR